MQLPSREPPRETVSLLARSRAMVLQSRRLIDQSRDLVAVSPVRGLLRRHFSATVARPARSGQRRQGP